MRPPIPIEPTCNVPAIVLEACRRVVTEPHPILIPVHVEPYSQREDCHANVWKKIQCDAGVAQCGWLIWEIPDWSVSLEFHSVWKSCDGKLVDVSPSFHGGPWVLFLPDPTRKYEGLNIATIHYPYNASALCRDYVDISDRMNRLILPPGKKPIHPHEVPATELAALKVELRSIYARAKAGLT